MVGNDITERKQAEEAERNKVQLIIQRQKALLELEQTEPQDLDSRLRQITAVAAKILEVDRVGVWFFDEGRSAIRCNHLYHRSKDLHGVGPTFHAKQYPRYFEALRTNRVVAAPDARTDPRTSEFREGYLEPLGITSMMDVPIWVQGEVVGIVCHEHTGPARQWLPEEQGFAGSVADLISVAVETSQRKRAEDALRASEEKYRQLVENLYDVIVASDNEGRITYISPAVFTLTGYSPSEIVGRPFLDFVHPEDAALAWQNFQNNLAGMPQTFELRVVTKSGEAIWVRSNARAIQSKGRVTGALGVMTDITERKRAEESQAQLQAAIRDVATEWRLTFDAVEFPVLLLDMTGSVRRINRAAQELTGRRYEDVLGQSIAQLGKGQPWLKAAEVVDLIRERHAPPCQVKDDLTGKTWEITATLYTGPRENRTGVILIIRDITRMVELQESLRHSETMSALGQLVSGVAHEVRNPLFGISATIDALEASLASVAGYERHMEVLRRELGRLSDLMRDLLDYGTPPSLELSVQHIDDVIAQAMKSCVPLADQSRVQLTKVGGVTRPLTLDKRRAIQVFQNLVDNAIRHSPVGGVVIIEVEETQQNGQTWIECRVKDSGPGIREADKSRIFEPFFTRRRGGTGLGLSIVQRIVEQHEGVIRAGNRPEGGAEITVRFPAVSRARGGRLKARS
jgi:PAS domain S-box-containing protein